MDAFQQTPKGNILQMPLAPVSKFGLRLCTIPGALLVSFILFLATPVIAAGTFVHVKDESHLFAPQARKYLEEIGRRLMAERKIPILVVTIESLAAHGAEGTTIRAYAKGLVERPVIGVEKLGGQDWTFGILLVYAKEDHALAIHTGRGWDSEHQERLKKVSDEVSLPFFSRSLNAEGIIALVEAWEGLARVTEQPALSYWEVFVKLEKAALTKLIDRIRHLSWKNFTYFIPYAVIPFFVWELIRPWRKKQRHLRKELGLDIFYTLFNKQIFFALIGTAICGVTNFIFHDVLYRFFGIENMVAIHLNDLPLWLRYFFLLLAIDFSNYWIHRLLHRVDCLWEFHKIHHSAKELDVFNAIRLHFVELLVYRFLAYVPLGLIGFSLTDTFFVSLFISVFSFFTHANVRVPLGPLKYILNNPQLHVWHHTVEVHDRGNVNFGDALSVWDFIFGTGYAPEERTDLKLGFGGIEEYPTTFLGQLIVPFKSLYPRTRK